MNYIIMAFLVFCGSLGLASSTKKGPTVEERIKTIQKTSLDKLKRTEANIAKLKHKSKNK